MNNNSCRPSAIDATVSIYRCIPRVVIYHYMPCNILDGNVTCQARDDSSHLPRPQLGCAFLARLSPDHSSPLRNQGTHGTWPYSLVHFARHYSNEIEVWYSGLYYIRSTAPWPMYKRIHRPERIVVTVRFTFFIFTLLSYADCSPCLSWDLLMDSVACLTSFQ